jgi:hypothetical protein
VKIAKVFESPQSVRRRATLAIGERGLIIHLHRHSLEMLQAAAGAFVLRKIY